MNDECFESTNIIYQQTKNCVNYRLMRMLCKYKFWVLFFVSLVLSFYPASATSSEGFSFQQNSEEKPPLTLTEASIDSKEPVLSHNEIYHVSVQIMNTRPYGVDGVVELSAFSLSEDPVVLGLETVELGPDTHATLSFTFSPGDLALPCTNYIFMVTTDPSSLTHISEHDYIFVDGRHEFVFSDCGETEELNHLSNQMMPDISEKAADTAAKGETSDSHPLIEEEERVKPAAPENPPFTDSDDESYVPTYSPHNTDLDVNVTKEGLTH